MNSFPPEGNLYSAANCCKIYNVFDNQYHTLTPAAEVIRGDEELRKLVRTVLSPVVRVIELGE